MHQLNLFDAVADRPQAPAEPQEVTAPEAPERIRIRKRWSFERSAQPIGLPHFHDDMLYVDDDDKTVFKRCECGAVYAFNTDSAYSRSLIVCYGCGVKTWARNLTWMRLKRVRKGLVYDSATCRSYRLEVDAE